MDDIGKMLRGLGGGEGQAPMAAIGGLTKAIQEEGGLDSLLGKLRANGLGEHVDSWISNQDNRPVDPERLGQAPGQETVQQLADKSGLDIATLLPTLSAYLPRIVDMLTPGGQAPDGGLDSGGALPNLGGLFGR